MSRLGTQLRSTVTRRCRTLRLTVGHFFAACMPARRVRVGWCLSKILDSQSRCLASERRHARCAPRRRPLQPLRRVAGPVRLGMNGARTCLLVGAHVPSAAPGALGSKPQWWRLEARPCSSAPAGSRGARGPSAAGPCWASRVAHLVRTRHGGVGSSSLGLHGSARLAGDGRSPRSARGTPQARRRVCRHRAVGREAAVWTTADLAPGGRVLRPSNRERATRDLRADLGREGPPGLSSWA